MSFTVDEIRVARNIAAIADRWYPVTQVPRRVMLAITRQESSWNEQAVGDNGKSFSVFQIDVDYHPDVGPHISTDPWWDYGFPEIFRRWRDQWAASANAWAMATDDWTRMALIKDAAPRMQGSIQWTWQQAERAYADAVAMEGILDAGGSNISVTG